MTKTETQTQRQKKMEIQESRGKGGGGCGWAKSERVPRGDEGRRGQKDGEEASRVVKKRGRLWRRVSRGRGRCNIRPCQPPGTHPSKFHMMPFPYFVIFNNFPFRTILEVGTYISSGMYDNQGVVKKEEKLEGLLLASFFLSKTKKSKKRFCLNRLPQS